MPWDDDVADVVRQVANVSGVFTLDDVYRHRQSLQDIYPNNEHVDDKVRQCLQHLRDIGMIQFLDDYGTYRRLN